MLAEIEFPAELPDDFTERGEEHVAFGKLSEEFDLPEICKGREILDGLLIKYGAGSGLEEYLMRFNDLQWKFYEVYPFQGCTQFDNKKD